VVPDDIARFCLNTDERPPTCVAACREIKMLPHCDDSAVMVLKQLFFFVKFSCPEIIPCSGNAIKIGTDIVRG
jgi:hypothetical protein